MEKTLAEATLDSSRRLGPHRLLHPNATQHPLDQAVTRATQAMRDAQRNTPEWATAVRYLRSPNGCRQGDAGGGGEDDAQ